VSVGHIVVMGVAGCGKTTLANALAERLGIETIEADDLHSPGNVARMAAGVPLTDEDRWPWLAAVRQAMRSGEDSVVACSALRRRYRDALRSAGEVRFLYLAIDRAEALRRLGNRAGHFMGPGMLDSQLAALEPPAPDERDVATLPADTDVEAALAALAALPVGTATAPIVAVGGEGEAISLDELAGLIRRITTDEVLAGGARRILLVPPDHTRLHSRAGEITALLFEQLTAAGCSVTVVPALGTHAAMTPDEVRLLFGDGIPFESVRRHRWREGLVSLGEITADEIAAVSTGLVTEPIPVEVDAILFETWDLVISIGQVVPHEVIGMANFTKNLVIGLGGAPTINRSHFLGAVCDMEKAMGRAQAPVRDVVDAAFDRFLADRVPVLWLLSVMEDTPAGVVQRGLFAGRGGSGDTGGAAFRAAARLSVRCNLELVPEPERRVVCRLDPEEFRSTWLGNKAVYRTRMALADGGELVVLAPGVSRFGEDDAIDALIRRHGYHGTAATLDALGRDPELSRNLGAAAHLIHGSSEGRFRITYCTDPAGGGLTREEVEGVGYGWRPLPEELELLGVSDVTPTGARHDRDGAAFAYIANPALGLWATAAAFA
jgi:carbohydrate kinase (thermoresistant glucokinase family)